MTSETRMTTDHDEIRRWVEQHVGAPSAVKGTGGQGDPGVLQIDFPGGAGEGELEHLSWDQWFEKFEESGLALLYQKEKASGEGSTLYKLVRRSDE